MTSSTYRVTGMTCEHCVHAVTGELKNLGGVTGVTVALVLLGKRSSRRWTRPATTGSRELSAPPG
jgi:hypothetical protein